MSHRSLVKGFQALVRYFTAPAREAEGVEPDESLDPYDRWKEGLSPKLRAFSDRSEAIQRELRISDPIRRTWPRHEP